MQVLLMILSIAMVILFTLVVIQYMYHYNKKRHERFTTPVTTDAPGYFCHTGDTQEECFNKLSKSVPQ